MAFAGAPAHRQMRAKRVAKDVKPARRAEACTLLRRLEEVAQKEARRRSPVVAEQHVLTAQMAVRLQRVRERVGKGHDA
jgi:hypothetical protein